MRDDDNDPLLARIRAHDPAALAAFLEARRPALLSLIERRLGAALRSKLEPQDILQNVAVKALRELPEIDVEDPFAWLCRLAEQCVVDDHRHFAAGKRATGREIVGSAPAADGTQDLVALLSASLTSPTQAAVRDERTDRLHEAMAQFSPEQREALRLRYGEGRTTKEVASSLNKSEVATRVLLTRLVHRLQELLAEN